MVRMASGAKTRPTHHAHRNRKKPKKDRVLKRLGVKSYEEFFFSRKWKRLRNQKLQETKRCELCESKASQIFPLEKTFNVLSGNAPWKLVCLCDRCHMDSGVTKNGDIRSFQSISKHLQSSLVRLGLWEQHLSPSGRKQRDKERLARETKEEVSFIDQPAPTRAWIRFYGSISCVDRARKEVVFLRGNREFAVPLKEVVRVFYEHGYEKRPIPSLGIAGFEVSVKYAQSRGWKWRHIKCAPDPHLDPNEPCPF